MANRQLFITYRLSLVSTPLPIRWTLGLSVDDFKYRSDINVQNILPEGLIYLKDCREIYVYL